MQWLNINTAFLDGPEFAGSEPLDRATWICLLRYCVGQENGGTIPGAKQWSDRKWQQLVRVTQREVRRSSPLWSWEGDDLLVAAYPKDKEAIVRHKREVARRNGEAGGRPSTARPAHEPLADLMPMEPTTPATEEPTSETNEKPTLVLFGKAEGEVEGKGKGSGMEMEGEGEGAGRGGDMPAAPPRGATATTEPPLVLDAILEEFPCQGNPPIWHLRQSLVDALAKTYPSLDVLAECRIAATKVRVGAVTPKTAKGMPRFLTNWLDRSANRPRRVIGGVRVSTLDPDLDRF